MIEKYSGLEQKIPLENLLRFQRWLFDMGEAGEQRILSLLQTYSLIINDDEYQIPIGNSEDFNNLKERLNDLARRESSFS